MMITKNKFLCALSLLALATSCTNEDLTEDLVGKNTESVLTFTIPAFEGESSAQTRTSFNPSNKYVTWASTETVGLRPDTHYGIALPFETSSYSSTTCNYNVFASTVYNLTNDDWDLKEGVRYTAFYPYQHIADKDNFSIDLSSKKTIESSATSSINISSFDYMYGAACECYHGSVTYSMVRIYGLLGIVLNDVPARTWKNIYLTTVDGKSTLATKAKFNFWQTKLSEISKTSKITFYSGSGLKRNSSFAIYFPLFECTTGNLKLVLESTQGETYSVDLASKTVRNGSFQKWTIEGITGYVDLGVGLMWGKTNLGAEVESEAGDFFGFGNPNPLQADNKYMNYYNTSTEKYNNNDQCPVLQPEDDAATAILGEGWRTPTYHDVYDIMSKCYWQYVENYLGTGVNGYLVFKAKNSSDMGKVNNISGYSTSTDNYIFLPKTYMPCMSTNAGIFSDMGYLTASICCDPGLGYFEYSYCLDLYSTPKFTQQYQKGDRTQPHMLRPVYYKQ